MTSRATKLLLALLPLWPTLLTAQGTLYRWVDDNGNVHYTDSIPPSQVSKGHAELSERGVLLKTVPPAQTPEEIAQDRELKRLRAEQERLIAQQRAADRVLLRSFRSDDDLIMARDGKLASINVMIQVIKNNIRRQQEWLAAMRAEAANMERSGKSVPQQLADNIDKTERSIKDAHAAISAREAQKTTIRESFDRDLTRFRRLRSRGGQHARRGIGTLQPVLHAIVTCADGAACDLLWERATAYLRAYATTELQSTGANILMAVPPTPDSEAGLILSRIRDPQGEGASIFLDLRCPTSLRGEKPCPGPDTRTFVEGFRAAVTGQDKLSTPP